MFNFWVACFSIALVFGFWYLATDSLAKGFFGVAVYLIFYAASKTIERVRFYD